MIQRHAESGSTFPRPRIGGKLKEFDASRIVKGVLEAVAYLHDFDIAHRDLKPGYWHRTILRRQHHVRKAE